MKKSEKRRIGEAKQAQNLKDSIESGLKAQTNDRIARQERKAAIEKARLKKANAEKAKNAMKKLGESFDKGSKASKELNKNLEEMANSWVPEDEDYPLVLDMTDETAHAG